MAAQEYMLQFLMEQIKKGIFIPQKPLEDIVSFTCVTIDGIANDYALHSNNQGEDALMKVDIDELFRLLAESVLNFLGRSMTPKSVVECLEKSE